MELFKQATITLEFQNRTTTTTKVAPVLNTAYIELSYVINS